ncbi:DNA segregation ATPase FtsK/SpoIIIE-like protein [Rhizobium sp. BK196]|nr:DNA segregation ATPase FtsK/SpoIIIE-like protein [Rhizobium sp. BK196]
MTEENNEDDALDLAADTLFGDLRDAMLMHVRSMETPWSKMSEKAQADKIYAIGNACETLVRKAVAIVASNGNEPMFGRIAKFTVKDEIKAELIAGSSVANIEKIAENIGQPAIIIFASPEGFMGAKAEAKADKDQPELPGTSDDEEAEDEQYDRAVVAIRQSGKASTSFIQRTLSIGYNRAASLIERMEKEGVVGPADTSGKREILVAPLDPTLPDADPSDAPEAA